MIALLRLRVAEILDFRVEQHFLAGRKLVAVEFLEHAIAADFGAEVQVSNGERSGLAKLRRGLADVSAVPPKLAGCCLDPIRSR